MKDLRKLLAIILALTCLTVLVAPCVLAEGETSEVSETSDTSETSDVSEPEGDTSSEDTTSPAAETYTITVVSNEGGKVFIDGFTPVDNVYTIPKGTSVVIKAVSDTDKSIEHFKIGGVSMPGVNGKTSYEYPDSDMTDRTYEVKFKDDTSVGRDITFTGSGYTFTVNGATNARANLGTVAHIVITPNEGMRIDSVKLGGEEKGTEFDITVGETNVIDVVTTAIGEQQPVFITVEGEGSVLPDSGSYYPQTTVEFTIAPSMGYVIGSVTVNGTDRTSEVKDGKLTVVTGDTPTEIKAVFVPGARVEFNIIGSGSVTPETGYYAIGSDVTFTFVPKDAKNDRWLFKSLVLGAEDITSQVVNNSITLHIGEEDVIYDVEFGQAITVTPNLSSGGKLFVNGIEVSSAKAFLKGTDLEITVEPAIGYKLDTFRIDGVLKTMADGKYTVAAVAADLRIAVKFALTDIDVPVFTVTATAGAHGAISPAGENDARSGDSIMFTFIPETGYIVDTVTVDGAVVNISSNSYTMTGITANSNIHVTFKKDSASGPSTDDCINATDVDWSRETIYINITQKSKVSAEVFEKIVASGKTCVIYSDRIKILIPAGGSVSVAAGKESVDLSIEVDGTDDGFESILNYVSDTFGTIDYTAIKLSRDVQWPDGTTFSYNMGSLYAGKSLDYLVLKGDKLSSPTKADGSAAANRASVDGDGWICVYYFNDEYVAFCESLEMRYTIVASAGEGGSISPEGNKSVTTGNSATYSIVAADGYIIKSIKVDGVEVTDAAGQSVYTHVFDHVVADHTIDAQFEQSGEDASQTTEGGQSAGLIVAIVIIVLAVIAAGVLFFIRWKQERY